MAGGQDRQYRPLAERLGWDRSRPAAAPVASPTPGKGPAGAAPERHVESTQRPSLRHCWIVDAPEAAGRWPGVLLGWERDGKGWLGRVMMAVEGREGMVTMTLWVRAEHLRPISTKDDE